MAAKPATKTPKNDDFQAHVANYEGFTKLFTYGAVACLLIGLFVMLIIS